VLESPADVLVGRPLGLTATGAHCAHLTARAARSGGTSTRLGSRTRRVLSCSAATVQAAPRSTAAAMNATWKPDTRAAATEPAATGPWTRLVVRLAARVARMLVEGDISW